MSVEIPPAKYHEHAREDVMRLIKAQGGTLLDVGGGVGNTARLCRDRGLCDRAGVIDLVAPPQPPEGLDFAAAGDLSDPEFLDEVTAREGPFQTILCLDVLEHLVDPWGLVARLHQSLAPGGSIVASIPNVRFCGVSVPLALRGQWRLQSEGILDRTHLRFFVRETAIELMTHSGLQIDAIEANVSAPGIWRIAKWLGGPLQGLVDYQYLLRVTRPNEQ